MSLEYQSPVAEGPSWEAREASRRPCCPSVAGRRRAARPRRAVRRRARSARVLAGRRAARTRRGADRVEARRARPMNCGEVRGLALEAVVVGTSRDSLATSTGVRLPRRVTRKTTWRDVGHRGVTRTNDIEPAAPWPASSSRSRCASRYRSNAFSLPAFYLAAGPRDDADAGGDGPKSPSVTSAPASTAFARPP